MGDNGRLLLYSTVFYLDRDDTKSMGESTKLRPDSRRITQYVSVSVTSHPAASRDVSEAAGHVHLCLTPPQTQQGHNATATAWWFPVADQHSKILDVRRLPSSPNFWKFWSNNRKSINDIKVVLYDGEETVERHCGNIAQGSFTLNESELFSFIFVTEH